MDLVINTAGINQFFNLPSERMFWVFMANLGWLMIAITFLIGMRRVYLFWRQLHWKKSHQHLLLAIDIPKGNEQTPKAVENMFTYLGGAHATQNFFEKWFIGEFQKSFSYEIVSQEGYTQFLIWTPVEFRNLIESSVYSQYPDAEITEVDDYTQTMPQHWPNEEYDLWGCEFIQSASKYYPIKSYLEFEHPIGPSELQFKDPMASLMDLCGSLRQGEQLWMQMIITPIGFDWIKEADRLADKILERRKKPRRDLFGVGLEALGELSEVVYPIWQDVDRSPKKEEKPKSMMELSPKEKRQLEGLQFKASKLGFDIKTRMVYVAKKEVMNVKKVVNGFIGYIKQFTAMDLNALKPDLDKTATRTAYFFKEMRLLEKKRRIFRNYVKRSNTGGRQAGLMNIEELATLWHFPVEANVKSPLIQRAPGKKADAPYSLPLAAEEKTQELPDIFKTNNRPVPPSLPEETPATANPPDLFQAEADLGHKEAAPPSNLPT